MYVLCVIAVEDAHTTAHRPWMCYSVHSFQGLYNLLKQNLPRVARM